MNDISSEDRKKTVVELKSFFFNTFYLWTNVLAFPNVLDFHVFFFFLLFFPF